MSANLTPPAFTRTALPGEKIHVVYNIYTFNPNSYVICPYYVRVWVDTMQIV